MYGLCHEVGHICMYRLLKERAWLTKGACEGWAHYFGAHVVDLLYRKYGNKIWPDRHDYSDRGLKKTLNKMKRSKDDIERGAYQWSLLVEIVGEKGMPKIFRALDSAKIDSFHAAGEVAKCLGEMKQGGKLDKWWKKAEDVLLAGLEASDFKTSTVRKSELERKPKVLSHDEGEPTGMQSWPGSSGAAVSFAVDGGRFYLTKVNVYGQRYGKKTDENFYLWLLDEEFKAIKRFPVPYEAFKYGAPHWEEIEVEPTLVPREFFICVVFNAERDKGIYRFHDGTRGPYSFTGIPGHEARGYNDGDWLIRAVVARKK